ncbi:MAG: hypothetical protein U1F43_34945 [Myxococcota bacterium]
MRRGLAAVLPATALAAALVAAPRPAAADDYEVSFGVFIEVFWGGPNRIGIGADLELTRRLWGSDGACSEGDIDGGAGVLARGTWIFPDASLLALGLHLGRELDAELSPRSWDIELGGVWRSAIGADPAGRGVFASAVMGFRGSGEARLGGVLLTDAPQLRGAVETAFGLRIPGKFAPEVPCRAL